MTTKNDDWLFEAFSESSKEEGRVDTWVTPEKPNLARAPDRELTPVPSEPARRNDTATKRDLPTVAGHVLEPNEWTGFETYSDTGNMERAAEAAGVTAWTIWRWRGLEWWKELHRQFIQHRQEWFHQQMASKAEDILDGLFEVIDGDDKTDKTANARVQAAKLFMEAGSDPIINRRPEVQIQHNKFEHHGTLNINKVRELGRERILEIVSGSVAPPKEVLD